MRLDKEVPVAVKYDTRHVEGKTVTRWATKLTLGYVE